MWSKIASIVCLAGFLTLNAASPLASPPTKKLIRFGWGDLTADRLLKEVGNLEKNSPFDGVGIIVRGQIPESGQTVTPRFIFDSKTPWHYDWFRSDIQKLKQVKYQTFKHNFLCATVRPGGVDWFDDRAWSVVTAKFGLLARIARETGCVGIEIDPEYYQHDSQPQFNYDPQKGHSFEESWEKARQRGQEVGKAIAKAFPNTKILAFFWLSYILDCTDAADPFSALRHHHKGLYAAFINGMYESNTDMVFLEGFEELGYRAKTPAHVQQIVYDFHHRLPLLLTPDNRRKYTSMTQLALPLYMDAYFTASPTSTWNIMPEVPLNDVTTRLRQLGKNLQAAYENTGEYVWIWEEFGTWWPREQMSVRERPIIYWEKHAPGITQLMRDLKNPRQAADAAVDRKKRPNLLNNGDFEAKGSISAPPVAPDHRPSSIPGWSFWSADQSAPGFQIVSRQGLNDSQALLAADFKQSAILSQTIPVKPGEQYLIRGYAREVGNGAAQIRVFWQTIPGRWSWDPQTPIVTVSGELLPDGWKKFLQCVTIPPQVQRMGIILDVAPQRPQADQTYFDNIEVFKL